MPLYAMLYAFSQIAVQRRYDWKATVETIESTIRSSSFIFFHAYNGSLMACTLRWTFGRWYYRVLICMPALVSCYLSLLIEKPSRRQALAFYMLNMASEIVYRMLVQKRYFIPIRHGETLLFAASLAAWFHLIKQHGFGHDPVSLVVKLVLGKDEAKSRRRIQLELSDDKHIEQLPHVDTTVISPLDSNYQDKNIETILDQMTDFFKSKHMRCPHAEATCLKYATSQIASRFGLGYAIQVGLKLVGKPYDLIIDPKTCIMNAITNPGALRTGMFLASLVASNRVVSCSLRRYSNSNSEAWHAPVAGFLSGLSMLWAPRSSLSMYIMWKAVEQYYLQAARAGKVRYFDFTIMSIYACSAATILYAFALEPRFVRPSYMKFLDTLSDHRLHQLNRLVLDVFGTGSSFGYEDFFPDLHPDMMSNEFKELVFNWLIQPS